MVRDMLRAGILQPVDVSAMTLTDIHNAYRNADEHVLLSMAVDPDKFPESERESGKRALEELYGSARRVRRDAKMLLIWRRVPLAKPVADKYRKAIAENYPAMIEAGSVLVKLGEPELAMLYQSPCTR
jgi:hypothetical protein